MDRSCSTYWMNRVFHFQCGRKTITDNRHCSDLHSGTNEFDLNTTYVIFISNHGKTNFLAEAAFKCFANSLNSKYLTFYYISGKIRLIWSEKYCSDPSIYRRQIPVKKVYLKNLQKFEQYTDFPRLHEKCYLYFFSEVALIRRLGWRRALWICTFQLSK